jgi:alpha-mannosidase
MLKHPKITSGRIAQFIKYDLQEQLLIDPVPLKIEFCEEGYATHAEAKKGEYREVEAGFRYGPAYRTVWFRITGRVPARYKGWEVGVKPDIGGERTIWKDNSPWRGVDGPHNVITLHESAGGGEKVELYVQVYTTNPQVRMHRFEPPREELVETVEGAALYRIDRELADLYYDCEFTYNLLSALDEHDPTYATIMRALNTVCNTYRAEDRETIARCRKIIRDALGTLNGEIKHTLTPVGHAHLDTAWLWPLHITMKKMAHTTATQLGLLERYPEYVFAHSQASQYEWLELQYPKLFERVKEAVARGQWEPVGSMWVEADCNLSGGESLVRQFLYGRRYFRDKLGYQTHDMFLPDVFGYSAALPQILGKFGIKYFFTQKISWNQFNKFPHHTFWWQGIDGSRVWTHFSPADTYCCDCTPKQMLFAVKNYEDHARCDQSLYLFGFGDGGGGPTEKHIEFLRRARMAPNLPEVASGRKALDFYRDAKARSRDLMTWSGELYLEYHRGTYTSQAANKRDNRYCEFLLRDAEWLSCFRDDFPRAYPAEELERLWKIVLLNQFHDIIPGSSVREVYEDSARDYAEVKEAGEQIVASCLENIGTKFDTSDFQRPIALYQGATGGDGIARIPWTEEEAPASLLVGEESLPVQKTTVYGEPHIVFPAPAAAMGAVAIGDLSDAAPHTKYRLKASNRKLENGSIGVRFDAHGNIVSIESLEDGSEFIAPGKLANLFQIFEDKPLFWSAWDVDPFALETGKDLVRSESFEIVERGPVRVAAQLVKRFGDSEIRQRISLGPSQAIYFETEIDWRETDKMLKVAFPINVNAQRATYEIQFGNVERPTHYNTSWDAARFEVCAQKWVDLSEGDHGVALLNDGKYGHDIHGNLVRMTLLRAPKAPDPLCDMGLHRFTYVLVPHFGPYNYAGIVQAAYALNAPMRWARLPSGPGQTGSLPPLVSCEDRNLVVESVKKAEDDDAIIVRLYECHNSRGTAELICARQPKSACLCNLDEVPGEDLEVSDGMVRFAYRPFEIITIRLEV